MHASRMTERLLNLLTAAVAVTALAVVWIDRIQPTLAAPDVAQVGDEVSSRLSLRTVPGGETVATEHLESALLVVYQSTCPVCERVAPQWARLAELAPNRVFALGLEDDEAAAEWIGRKLPGAVQVSPDDLQKFQETFRIRAVPTTLLVDGGRLALNRIGPLTPVDLTRVRETLAPALGP